MTRVLLDPLRSFDRVVSSRDSEGSAAVNRPPSSRQVDPSILKELRSKILRDVLSTMKSPEEVAQMSAAEIARAEAAWSEFLDRALEVGISGEHANSIGGR